MTYVTLFYGLPTEEIAEHLANSFTRNYKASTYVQRSDDYFNSGYHVYAELAGIQVAAMKGSSVALDCLNRL